MRYAKELCFLSLLTACSPHTTSSSSDVEQKFYRVSPKVDDCQIGLIGRNACQEIPPFRFNLTKIEEYSKPIEDYEIGSNCGTAVCVHWIDEYPTIIFAEGETVQSLAVMYIVTRRDGEHRAVVISRMLKGVLVHNCYYSSESEGVESGGNLCVKNNSGTHV